MKKALFVLLSFAHSSFSITIKQKPSLNFNERKDKKKHTIVTKPKYIILHYTADCHKSQAYRALSNFFRPVSAHYLIAADGTVLQLVDETKRAWHAGKSSWRGNKQMNTYSIGIEIVNPGFTKKKKDPCTNNKEIWNQNTGKQVTGSDYYWYPFTQEQIESTVKLCKEISKRYNIAPEYILGHSDIAPGRKVDPGPLFPWKQLAENDVGAWPNKEKQTATTQPTIIETQKALQKWGYSVPISGKLDKKTKQAIQAFQIHFRSENINGTLDAETISLLQNLISKYAKK